MNKSLFYDRPLQLLKKDSKTVSLPSAANLSLSQTHTVYVSTVKCHTDSLRLQQPQSLTESQTHSSLSLQTLSESQCESRCF